MGWEGLVAETEGFEPSVPDLPVRRFSKPLVSATHPRLRMARISMRASPCQGAGRLARARYSGGLAGDQPDSFSLRTLLHYPPQALKFRPDMAVFRVRDSSHRAIDSGHRPFIVRHAQMRDSYE